MNPKVISLSRNVFFTFEINENVLLGTRLTVGPQSLVGYVVRYIGNNRYEALFYDPLDSRLARIGDEVTFLGQSTVVFYPNSFGKVFDGFQKELVRNDISPEAPCSFRFFPVCETGQLVGGNKPLGYWVENEKRFFIFTPSVPKTIEAVRFIERESFEPGEVIAFWGDIAIKFCFETPLNQQFSHPSETSKKLFETGLRIIDTFYPIMEGTKVIVPGGFGTGKTNIMKYLMKNCDIDVVILIGCGERGNEIKNFVDLVNADEVISRKTISLAGTSDMPFLMRRDVVLVGKRLAEYFASMGMRVLIITDSLSRWAESMRELTGLERKLPSEGGYHPQTPSFLYSFFSTAGVYSSKVSDTKGSVTLLTVLSPSGGDFTEPISSFCSSISDTTLFLSTALRERRHFPTVDWENSFTRVLPFVSDDMTERSHPDFLELRQKAISLLDSFRNLSELARIIGMFSFSKEKAIEYFFGELLINHYFRQMFHSPEDGYMVLSDQYLKMNNFFRIYEYYCSKVQFDENDTVLLKGFFNKAHRLNSYEEFEQYVKE